MYISELLSSGRPTVSCELFPPKLGGDFEQAERVVRDTVALRPDFISVTCSAGSGTGANSARMASDITALGANALAHLTCLNESRVRIASLIENMKDAGIENILALRGDIQPCSPKVPTPEHNYEHAAELVAELREHGGFCVGAACYPEGHVECDNQKLDIRYLKEKADAGCQFLITQMFFDNNVLYRFLYKIREAGITVPIIAGIMPVTNKAQIRRMIELSGSSFPPRLANIVDKFSSDALALSQAGIAYATDQIVDLLANGVHGVHIYTMNKPQIAGKIMDNISRLVRAAV